MEYSWLAGLIVSGMMYLLRALSFSLTAERTAIDLGAAAHFVEAFAHHDTPACFDCFAPEAMRADAREHLSPQPDRAAS
jgi:hypothetical protein